MKFPSFWQCVQVMIEKAFRRPSFSAPSRTRCTVAGRWTVPCIICWRVKATFTGRPRARAASAASVRSS